MDRRDDIEVRSDDAGPVPADDDVVELGRPQVPRRSTALICITVAAVAVALLAVRATHRHRPAAGATPAPTLVSAPVVAPPDGLGDVVDLGRSQVFDAVLAGESLYALQLGRLTLTAPPVGSRPAAEGSRRVDPGLPASAYPSASLVLDRPKQRLWIVVEDIPGGQLLEFDAGTLQPLRHSSWPEQISGSAVLAGHLFLSTPSGIVDFAPGAARPIPISALHGWSGWIAADPRRGRLLVLDSGWPTKVLVYRPGASRAAIQSVLPFGKASLGITADGTIWAGGYGTRFSQAVLVLLNPRTLQPVLFSSLAARLGPGAVIEAAGDGSLWVRSGSSSEDLWCVDGRTGEVTQLWNDAVGTVTSERGAAYLASGTVVRPFALAGCAG
jgi:hypothetical protein